MKKAILTFSLILIAAVSSAENTQHIDGKKMITGFDGGMMVHSGYLSGNISAINHKVSGAPAGIGGVVRFHLGDSWRVGMEGYMSKLGQMNNGSHLKYVWGGFLFDYSLHFGDFSLFAGLTLGGGANTDLLMFETPSEDWAPIARTVYRKIPFWAVDPFAGVEYALSDAMRLTLKFDCLRAFSAQASNIPMGPRVYLGFIFSH